MFVTNQRVVARSREWVPLATQQVRLRNLLQVLAYNIKSDSLNNDDISVNKETYSFTLHFTTMSAPFYTSEKQDSDSPKWKEFDATWRDTSWGSTDALIVRLWSHNDVHDNEVSVWGVHLSGLTYLGPHLGVDTPALKSNSLVFRMVGGYFTGPNCIEAEPMFRFVSVNTNPADLHNSYTVNVLLRLRTLQQAIKKQIASAEVLKQKISIGDFFSSETRERSVLRRLLNKSKPKVNHSEVMRQKELVEEHKFRVQLLKEEKTVLVSRLRSLKERVDAQCDRNQLSESSIMERYRLLRREVVSQREWRRGHIDRREAQLHSRAMLNFRSKQLVSELNIIYPIEEKDTDKFTICGVHLPDSEDFVGHDETQVAVALGFVTHVVQMVSTFLQVPLRYSMVHLGSRSRIVDHISEKIPDTEREFPLYSRTKDKLPFHYAVYLLNKNIAQLRWLCGLPTQDLRSTLANLSALVKLKSGISNLDYVSRSLSSSTADLCGSTLSMSSPVSSVFSAPPRRGNRVYRLSESDTVDCVIRPLGKPHIHRHRVSKSAGSAKDFNFCEANEFPLKAEQISNENALGHSMSFSLDKGLDDYQEISKSGNLHSVGPILNQLMSATTEKTDTTLEQNGLVQSNGITDNQNARLVAAEGQTSGESFDVKDVEMAISSEMLVKTHEIVVPKTESKVASDIESKEVTPPSQPDTSHLEVDQCRDAVVADDLLEDVASRAEILANQATTFNRFRSRYKSTVESSNA